MKNPANKSNVKRIAWVLKYMDSKGDTYTCPFLGILTRYLPEVYTEGKLREDIQGLSKFIHGINNMMKVYNDYS